MCIATKAETEINEKNRRPKHDFLQLQPSGIRQKSGKHPLEKRPCRQNGFEKLNSLFGKMKLNSYLSTCTKMRSKWIKYLTSI